MNERLIKEDQLEYQEELRSHYKDMLRELSAVMNEQVRLSQGRPDLSRHRKCPFYPQCHKDQRKSLLTAQIAVRHVSTRLLSGLSHTYSTPGLSVEIRLEEKLWKTKTRTHMCFTVFRGVYQKNMSC